MLKLALSFFLLSTLSQSLAINLGQESLEYGESKKGHKLKSFFYYSKKTTPSKVLILAEGVHGNEYIGFTEHLISYLERDQLAAGFKNFFAAGGSILITPKINADGVENRRRVNASGIDLNRHFLARLGKKNEASQYMMFIKSFLQKKSLRPVFGIDYHCCGGKALLPTYSKKNFFYAYLQKSLGHFLGSDFKLINTRELFGKTFEGTLKDFYNTELNIPSITFEARSTFRNSKDIQHKFLDNILMYFSNEQGEVLAYNKVSREQNLSMLEYKKRFNNYSE